MTLSEPTQPAPLTRGNPWPAMVVVMTAAFMFALDTTIVSVALHPIAVDLDAGSGIEWVVSIYLLAVAAAQPIAGWLSDRFGRRAMFLVMLAVFTGASAACAASPSLGFLVFFRAIQGLGGGGLVVLGLAIALDLFPRRRHGFVAATWGTAALVGPALGPTVGGWLVTSVSWHWLFLINVPIGAVALAAGLFFIPQIGYRERRAFDLGGLLLGSGGLSLVILGLSEGNQWGWASPATLICLAFGVGALVAFVPQELGSDHPMLELRMFGHRAFRLSSAIMLLVVMAQFGRLVYIPLELESVRDLSALRVGILFLPAAMVQAIGMQVGGRLVDRIGWRLPMISGCAMLVAAVAGYAWLTLATPLVFVVVLLCVQGFGAGLTMTAATVGGLSDIPHRLLAQGAAVRSLAGQVGGAMSVALLGAIVAIATGSNPTPSQAQDAYNAAFAVAAGVAFLAFVLACRMPKPKRSSDSVAVQIPSREAAPT